MKHILIILLAGLLFGSCNNWMDLAPENERLSDEYWTSKEDVHNTMMSCYVRLRACQELILQWGEIRADAIALTGKAGGTDGEDLPKMSKQNLTSENTLVNWEKFYKVINSANSVIQYAPGVLKKDPLFTEEIADQYIAEAKAVRSLAYFYLVRAFRDVPLVTDAYLTDAQDLFKAKSTDREILDRIILDLKWSLKRLQVTYSTKMENKCRVTRWAAQTLLADIYLWDEKYKECADACELIMKSERYRLVGVQKEEGDDEDIANREKWFDIFYPGLSDESIWELYYDQENNQTNTLFDRFKKDGYYSMLPKLVDKFQEDEAVTDLRALNSTYTKDNLIWKYLGTLTDGTTMRGNNNKSANWIFYRYADVLMMYAEACVLLKAGDPANNLKAAAALNAVKERAGVPVITEADALEMSQRSFLEAILAERKKEFVAEGKRWFDLVRVAKKDNYTTYRDMIISVLLENVPMAEKAIYQTKLSNPYSLYFPIHKTEIDAGQGLLVQNPAYQ